MSELTCGLNYEAMYDELMAKAMCEKEAHIKEKDDLRRRIGELEHELMIYEQKWSVIQLIFGK